MTASRLLTINQYGDEYGPGRSATYELLKARKLEAVKVGKRTLITRESAEAWLEQLPRYTSQTAE